MSGVITPNKEALPSQRNCAATAYYYLVNVATHETDTKCHFAVYTVFISCYKILSFFLFWTCM